MRGVHSRQPFTCVPCLGCALIVALCLPLSGAWASNPTADLETLDKLQETLFSSLPEEQRSIGNPEVDRLATQYQALVSKHVDDPKVHAARARFLATIGQLSNATQEWQHAHRLDPKNADTVHQLAECYLAAKDVERAISWLEKAVQLQPASALYHFNLGNAYFLFRRQVARTSSSTEAEILAKALDQLRQSTLLAPQNPEFARGYAETFYGLPEPDWGAALKAWEHYSQVSDDKAFANPHLARIHIRLGQFQQARDALVPLSSQSEIKQLLERKITEAEAAKRTK